MSHTLRNTRRLFAAIATLTLAAGPAMAQTQPTGMERVEVHGGRVIEAVPRHDVHKACPTIDNDLTHALARTWMNTTRFGDVQVQFVLENGEVSGVSAKGVSNSVARGVRRAMYGMDCGAQKTAEAQVYRFTVGIVDPNALPRHGDDTRTAQRRVRINAGG